MCMEGCTQQETCCCCYPTPFHHHLNAHLQAWMAAILPSFGGREVRGRGVRHDMLLAGLL